MRQRDKYILGVLGVVILLGGFWMLLLSPKRSDLSDLDKQVSEKQAAVDELNSKVQFAQQAKVDYAATYATMAKLGKAVPEKGSIDDDVPSLLLQVNHAANVTRTAFLDYEASTDESPAEGGAAAAPPPAGEEGAAPAADTAAGQGEDQTTPAAPTLGAASYKVSFRGSFFDLESLLNHVTNLVTVKGENLRVSGRLLAVDSLDFTVINATSSGTPRMKVEMGMTAYTTSADPLAGATPGGPPDADSAQPQTTANQGSSDAVPGAPPQAQPATPPAAARRP